MFSTKYVCDELIIIYSELIKSLYKYRQVLQLDYRHNLTPEIALFTFFLLQSETIYMKPTIVT